ncbi:MAG: sugar phosphate isomerase/epimerase [Actinobacteria bacterium]|nr:sugar phosphate isomerase/epimerase [Actinomycetota bacterium]
MDLVKLACSSSAYNSTSLIDAIQRIAGIGYSAVEIRAGHERFIEDRPYEVEVQRIKIVLAKCNISVANIAVGGDYLGANAPCNEAPLNDSIWADRQHIERIKSYVRLARELNCQSLSINPGRVTPGVAEDVRASSIVAALTEIIELARGLGVAIGISYGPGLIFGKAADLEPLFLKCRGLKLALHVGNSHLACETPCNIAKEFKQRIKHIHIADVGCSDRPYLVPGTGEIEWISFFKTLRWIRYQGFVTVDLSTYQDIPDLAASRAFFYLSNIINGLKRPRLRDSA